MRRRKTFMSDILIVIHIGEEYKKIFEITRPKNAYKAFVTDYEYSTMTNNRHGYLVFDCFK